MKQPANERPQTLLARSGPAWLLIRDFDKHPITDGVRYFATQTGGRVVGEGIIARTSGDAWADAGTAPLYGEGNPGLTGDLRSSDSEDQGAQGILQAKSIDRGRIVVISDQNAIGDALISYADNWQLWLNACNWAGQLKIETGPLTIDKITTRQELASDPSAFDRLVSGEPDRNAQPTLPAGSWQIHCWEPLSAGNFHWGSSDSEQYYSFWCWLNRWCWASAHEANSNPAPAGRSMLLACESDLADANLKLRIDQVLRQRGKVVVLGTPKASLATTPSSPMTTPIDAIDTAVDIASDVDREKSMDPSKIGQLRTEWLRDILGKLFSQQEVQRLFAVANWQNLPLEHVTFEIEGGQIVFISNAQALQNGPFTPPEIAPNSMQSKWQRQLYHWLFEQP